jgi:hypothetical protein
MCIVILRSPPSILLNSPIQLLKVTAEKEKWEHFRADNSSRKHHLFRFVPVNEAEIWDTYYIRYRLRFFQSDSTNVSLKFWERRRTWCVHVTRVWFLSCYFFDHALRTPHSRCILLRSQLSPLSALSALRTQKHFKLKRRRRFPFLFGENREKEVQ